jgi:3D (Asp-Asp-Asp) domain-containing protein
MLHLKTLGLATLSLSLISCGTSSVANRNVKTISGVRTTAYTHSESDHIKYGSKTATGDSLKFGKVRSAATDWSVYPVGTVFKIEGEPWLYEVDDYGSALVGTNTIDLYKPDKATMNKWGAKHVNISVVKWGSFSKSLAIMRPREKKAPHVQQMVKRIETSS